MKKISIALVALFLAGLSGCAPAGVDQSTPEGVANAVFNAASTQNYDMLSGLCDPDGDHDGDVEEICNLKDENQDEFVDYFAKGKVSGEAMIEGDEAVVPVMLGPDGDEEEKMGMIKRDDKWYLYGL